MLQAVSAAQVGEADIETTVAALRGEISQIPSAVSAIKVGGKRAYQLAREGQAVELAARPVCIDRFEVRDVRRSGDHCLDVDVEVDCSSGTYIRALARDIGASYSASAGISPRCGVPASAVSGSMTRARSTRWPMNRS